MTILLVEDNDALRKLLCTILAAEGHTVLDAPSGEVAIALVESSSERIDLLITDLVLPRLSGPELARWISAVHGETSVIYMSGYPEGERRERGPGDLPADFLQKPFTPTQLFLAIDRLVRRRHSGNAG